MLPAAFRGGDFCVFDEGKKEENRTLCLTKFMKSD